MTILIEEDGVIVDCSLKTREPEDILDFNMEPESVVNKVLLHSELLKDVLQELDSTSSHIEVLKIYISFNLKIGINFFT